ncbi:17512_t:CDS:2, partial [Cetraspora pellucida]
DIMREEIEVTVRRETEILRNERNRVEIVDEKERDLDLQNIAYMKFD